MGRSVLPLALLFCGCFQLDRREPPAGGDDAPAADARAGADASPDGAPSDAAPLGPFGPPVPLVELNSPLTQEDDPSLTDDLLEIYFNRERALAGSGDADIWRATRPDAAAAFGAPQNVVELNSVAIETSPSVSGDGLTLYFTSNRDSPNLDVWVAARQSRDVAWGSPVKVVELSTPADEVAPWVSPDRLHAVLPRSTLDLLTQTDLYETARAAPADPWGSLTLIESLSSPAAEGHAWLDASGTLTVFASDRVGGVGETDLWTATRPGWGAAFGEITGLAELNTAFRDNDPWLSPDQRTIVFTSTRAGDSDLYLATR